MNYRHAYHAGNFADVFKHIILIVLTQSFLAKEKPFCYLDTHAGTGCYDLFSKAAQTNKEFELGIVKLLSQPNPPALIQSYLHIIQKMNPQSSLHFYPGSPLLVKEFLRAEDRMILSELHADEYQELKKCFARNPQVSIHLQDAYQSLKAFLPPKERRGLVLIDPPYEKPDEFSQLLKVVPQAIKRWETGVYAIWYPIKNRQAIDRFLDSLEEKIPREQVVAELSIYPEDSPLQLNGCGMIIINPPWKIKEELQQILPWLWNTLSIDKKGGFSLNGNDLK